MAYRIGVDVGGTFTDLMLFDEASGRYWRHKTPSTPTTHQKRCLPA
jgi:N-methylhydantoinase A